MVDRIVVGDTLLNKLRPLDENNNHITEKAVLSMSPEERENYLRALANIYGAPVGIFSEEEIPDIMTASRRKRTTKS